MKFNSAALKCTRLFPDVKLPRVATLVSIGADVYAYLKSETGRPVKFAVPPNVTRVVPTGLVVVSEPPYAVLVCSRSGLAANSVFVANAPGVIDPDYRGELKILVHNSGADIHWIEHGDRIAQLLLVPVPIPEVSESEFDLRQLTSIRGEAGFGSTGR